MVWENHDLTIIINSEPNKTLQSTLEHRVHGFNSSNRKFACEFHVQFKRRKLQFGVQKHLACQMFMGDNSNLLLSMTFLARIFCLSTQSRSICKRHLLQSMSSLDQAFQRFDEIGKILLVIIIF